MKFNYFDIHSHFNLDKYDGGVSAAIARMKDRGVGTICVGVDFMSSQKAVEFAEAHEGIWATVGMHPTDAHASVALSEVEWAKFFELASNPKVVAIGECGLDYFRKKDAEIMEAQKKLFIQHIELAQKVGKPLMIHARPSKTSMDAYEDVIEILKNYPSVRANIHFFVGDVTIAKQMVELGFTMSFDGPITFSRDYDEVIKFLPLENIMAETDAPFAAPEPYRGKTCEPWMVEEVYKKIAEIKGFELEEIKKQIFKNIERVFGIPCTE